MPITYRIYVTIDDGLSDEVIEQVENSIESGLSAIETRLTALGALVVDSSIDF